MAVLGVGPRAMLLLGSCHSATAVGQGIDVAPLPWVLTAGAGETSDWIDDKAKRQKRNKFDCRPPGSEHLKDGSCAPTVGGLEWVT